MIALSDEKGYPLRTRICMALCIDPLTPDEALYNEITDLRTRVAELEAALMFAMPKVHDNLYDGHSVNNWRKCSNPQCRENAKLIPLRSTPPAPDTPAPSAYAQQQIAAEAARRADEREGKQ